MQIQFTEEERAVDSERAGAQLYEEIRDLRADVAAQGITASSRRTTSAPEYEDIVPAGGKTDAYQITQCSAYGVSINN